MLIVRSNFVNSNEKGEIFSFVHVGYICKRPASRQFHEPIQTTKSACMSVQCQAAGLLSAAPRRNHTKYQWDGLNFLSYHDGLTTTICWKITNRSHCGWKRSKTTQLAVASGSGRLRRFTDSSLLGFNSSTLR